MGVWSKLFGSDKAIDNIVDKDNGLLAQVGGWVGNLSYTDEERAEGRQVVRQWGLKQLDALAPFKVVQRILAFTAAAMWFVVGVNVLAAFWVYALWGIDVREDMLTFALSNYVFWPVMVVFGLYFTGGVIGSARRKPDDI